MGGFSFEIFIFVERQKDAPQTKMLQPPEPRNCST